MRSQAAVRVTYSSLDDMVAQLAQMHGEERDTAVLKRTQLLSVLY